MFKTLLMIGAGSFIGGTGRYLMFKATDALWPTSYPLGTLIVNVLGCFLLGLFYALFDRYGNMSQDVRMMLSVGVCGGFTTFSTFINENFNLFAGGHFLAGSIYILLSLAAGLAAIWFGHYVVNLF